MQCPGLLYGMDRVHQDTMAMTMREVEDVARTPRRYVYVYLTILFFTFTDIAEGGRRRRRAVTAARQNGAWADLI